jgi:hypothetical protein
MSPDQFGMPTDYFSMPPDQFGVPTDCFGVPTDHFDSPPAAPSYFRPKDTWSLGMIQVLQFAKRAR